MDNQSRGTKTDQLSILKAIGNTPLVRLQKIASPDDAEVLIKLEYYNPTGSYKDRMALSMIAEAEARGDLRPGMRVLEYTGGSTGTSLAFVCAIKGYPIDIVTSDAFAPEKLQNMRAFGANLTVMPSVNGQVTPDLTPRMIEKAREMAGKPGIYFTDQLSNPDVVKGYEPLGEEILKQAGRPVDGFCASFGSAGMLMGVARVLKRSGTPVKIVALEPAESPILSKGYSGSHDVEGIGIGFIPPHLEKQYYDNAWGIPEEEAREMVRRLAREEGIFAGTSTGLNVVGALRLAKELGPGRTVVTVAVDTGLKYLNGDLFEK
jgi:cysteine synthase A